MTIAHRKPDEVEGIKNPLQRLMTFVAFLDLFKQATTELQKN